MPLQYLTGTLVVSTPGADAVTIAANDIVIVAPGAVRGSTGTGLIDNPSNGIVATPTSGDVALIVQGSVFGNDYGIDLVGSSFGHFVSISATGQVAGFYGISSDASSLSLTNAGQITGASAAILDYSAGSTITNSGTITGLTWAIYRLGSGSTTVVNTGLMTCGTAAGDLVFYDAGISSDSFWNFGTIVGDIDLGSGNDLFQQRGSLVGQITGGLGNDTIIGGTGNDVIRDTRGTNWLAGGEGDDTITVAADNGIATFSHVFGGVMGGADTSSNDTIDVDSAFPGANIFLSAGTALGSVTRGSDGVVVAVITGFENAIGTFHADAIIGSSAANAIEGGNGGDWMVGNGGADRFVFRFAADADAGDQIRDFRRSEGDRIDLSAIDANTAASGEDAFVFRATRTSNAVAEAVATNFGNSARVDLYIDANDVADGTFIVVYGEAGVTNLQASDFIL